MSELPAALIAALRASSAGEPAPAPVPAGAPIRRGDLRFVRGPQPGQVEPRLVLVMSVDSDVGFAEVLLAHPYPDMACEVDAVIDRAVSGASYRVVVQSDLQGAVSTGQFGNVVGRLDAEALEEVGRVTTQVDVEGARGIHCGLRLAGVVDPRWEFKSDEGDALRAFTSDRPEAPTDEDDLDPDIDAVAVADSDSADSRAKLRSRPAEATRKMTIAAVRKSAEEGDIGPGGDKRVAAHRLRPPGDDTTSRETLLDKRRSAGTDETDDFQEVATKSP